MTPSAPLTADLGGIESLLSFWADAGIDLCLEEAPVNRLLETAQMMRAATPAPARPAVASNRGPRSPSAVSAAAMEEAAIAARTLAAQAMDMDALAQAIGAFTGCPLRRDAAHAPSLWRGAANAALMVIGEAPPAEDGPGTLPYSGREGRLLDRILGAVGLGDQGLITNTVFWQPAGGRAPTAAEQKTCLPFLERAIALTQPTHLLLLGAASARSLLGREDGVLALQGHWLDWRSSDGAMTLPVRVTLTPAFLLQQSAAKKKTWADMLALSEALGGGSSSA